MKIKLDYKQFKNIQMKNSILIIAIASIFCTFISCGGSLGNQPATADGFTDIEKQIKEEFGDDAYFTDISVVYNKAIGNIVGVTQTNDPESLKMGEWNQTQGIWAQNSEVFLELPPNTKAADFMYQLGDEISLKTLGELIEKSKVKLHDEMDLENPTLTIASIQYPDNGDMSAMSYLVHLEPEHGGTTYNFYYDINGELLEFDY